MGPMDGEEKNKTEGEQECEGKKRIRIVKKIPEETNILFIKGNNLKL